MKKTSTASNRPMIVLLLLAFALICVLFAPYISVFVLAIVFGVIFAPVNRWLRKYVHPTVAAILTTILVVVVIFGPVAFVAVQVIHEASDLAVSLQSGSGTTEMIAVVQTRVNELLPSLSINLTTAIHSGLQWVASKIGSVFSGILTVGVNVLLSIIALVYWFKDSSSLRKTIIELSPLEDEHTYAIIDALIASIHSVIKGALVVALVQGIVAGVGFTIFGVPNPILWGSVTAICALVPTLGTSIITLPIIGYLVLVGHNPQAVGMTIWALLAVGLVDNLVGPILMARGNKIHPFFILIGVIGGVDLFGPIGLLAGPLIISFFFAISKIYIATKNTVVDTATKA